MNLFRLGHHFCPKSMSRTYTVIRPLIYSQLPSPHELSWDTKGCLTLQRKQCHLKQCRVIYTDIIAAPLYLVVPKRSIHHELPMRLERITYSLESCCSIPVELRELKWWGKKDSHFRFRISSSACCLILRLWSEVSLSLFD